MRMKRVNRWLALVFAPALMTAACGTEEDPSVDGQIETEVAAVTATSPNRTWHGVTGLLVDIATGNGPASRWGIDTNDSFVGFRVVKWSGSQWAATQGRGVRIALKGVSDLNSDGISDAFTPWVVTRQGVVRRALDSSGNSWVDMPALPGGVPAIDIGSGTPITNMTMWAVGNDRRLYQFDEGSNSWFSPLGSPTNVIRVSGPVFGTTFAKLVFVLTAAGEVWALNANQHWAKLGTQTDTLRTDVSAGSSLATASADGFLASIMVTSAKSSIAAADAVRAFKATDTLGSGDFFGTGPYSVQGQVISGPPVAVSSDCDRKRVWIVTSGNRVYYGE
jgi:hypothetical protein